MSPAPGVDVILRSGLTKDLFEHLRDELDGSVVVGRGIAPPVGGWTGGEPGQGVWVDYTVLKTGRATSPAPGEPERLGRQHTSWLCTYQLTHHSTRESLTDELGDKVRAALASYMRRPLDLGGIDWNLQAINMAELGGSVRDDTTTPAHWSITDVVSLHLSRVSAR